MRLPLLAAALAAVAVATPAEAVVYPVCATSLANAAAGATASCNSDNTPQVAGATAFRVANVEVLAGVARVTVRCGFGAFQRSASIDVSGPQPRSVRVSESGDPSCLTEVTALWPNTTAVVVSTFTYQFIGPVPSS